MALVSEMVDVIGQGQTPPFAGLRDVRMLARRAAIGSMLTAEQLLDVAGTLTCTGQIYRWRMRLSEKSQRLIALTAPVEDLGLVAKAIAGCIDSRTTCLTWPAPSWPLSARRWPSWTRRCRAESSICCATRTCQDSPLSQRHRQRRSLRFARRGQLSAQADRRHPSHQQHRRDGLHRAGRGRPFECRAGRLEKRRGPRGPQDSPQAHADVGKVARPLASAIEAMAKVDYVSPRQDMPAITTSLAPTSTPTATFGCASLGIRCWNSFSAGRARFGLARFGLARLGRARLPPSHR